MLEALARLEPPAVARSRGARRSSRRCSARCRRSTRRSTARRRSTRSPRELVAPLLAATLSPTMIEASRKRNVIPGSCVIEVDCRLLPGQTPGRDRGAAARRRARRLGDRVDPRGARRRDPLAARHAALARARDVGRPDRAGRAARADRPRRVHGQPLRPRAPSGRPSTGSSRSRRWTRSSRRGSSTRPTSGSRSTTSSSGSTSSATSRRPRATARVRAGARAATPRRGPGSLVFLVVAPGVVAGLVPWLLTGWEATTATAARRRRLGGALVVAGAVCSRRSRASSSRGSARPRRSPRPSGSSSAASTATCATRCTSRWRRRSSGRRSCSAACPARVRGGLRRRGRAFVRGTRSRRSRAATAPSTRRTAAPFPAGGRGSLEPVARRTRGEPCGDSPRRSGGRVRRLPERDLHRRARRRPPDLPTDLTRLEALAEERDAGPGVRLRRRLGGVGVDRPPTARPSTWRIVPRMLRDVSSTDLSVTVLGTPMPAPVLLAPIGVLSIVHPTASRRSRAPPRASACRWSSARPPRRPSRTSPRRAATARAGTSSTGRRIASSPRASSSAPRPPGTARSSSPSTRTRWAGARATSTARSCRSSRASATRTTSPTRSSSGRSAAGRRRAPRPRDPPVGGDVRQPTLTWDDLAFLREHWERADRAQGHPASRRRAARGRRGHGRRRRLEPRRPPGRRRDRLARRPPRDRRGGRRPCRRAVRQRHPHRRRRRQGARARRRAVLLGRPYVYGLALAARPACATSCAACSPSSS